MLLLMLFNIVFVEFTLSLNPNGTHAVHRFSIMLPASLYPEWNPLCQTNTAENAISKSSVHINI